MQTVQFLSVKQNYQQHLQVIQIYVPKHVGEIW